MRKAYHKGHNRSYMTDRTYLTYTFFMSLEFALQYACPLRANYSEQPLARVGTLEQLARKAHHRRRERAFNRQTAMG